MSEMIIKSVKPPVPILLPSLGQEHVVQRARFFGALILAPIVVAVLLFWLYFIPVVAVVLGGIPYLLFGGPVYWHLIKNGESRISQYVMYGLLANFAFVVVGVIGVAAFQMFSGNASNLYDALSIFLLLYAGFGSVHAAVWSFAFASLYLAD